MPISVRRSSVGTSRPIPQKYIPYRADNYGQGKRTGITVDYVDTSDDFEPFDKVLMQADRRTPPKPKIQRKKRRPKTPKTPIVEEDDDGEMSMDIEDSTPNGPSAYFSSARVNIQSSVQRVGSSSRPVHRSSDVNYDDIPSPRAASSSTFLRRPSIATGRSSHASRLSQSSVGQRDFEEPFNAFDDVPGPPSPDESDNEPMMSPPRQLSRRTSFQQLGRDSDDQDNQHEEEQVVAQVTPKSAKSRGKQRYDRSPDTPMQDDYESEGFEDGGLSRIEEEPGEPMEFDEPQEPEEPEEPQEETPKASKPKRKAPPSPTKEKSRKKSRKENADPSKPRKRHDGILREVIQDNNADNLDGRRRSRRTRFPPLEYWRMEKVVYGRPDHGKSVIPVVKEILRVPKEDPRPLGAKKRRAGRGKSRSRTADPDGIWDPEEGWDDDTPTHGIVWGVKEDAEINKRIIQLKNQFEPKPAQGGEFEFEKMFADETFIAAGQMKIAPKKSKPTKSTKDNTFVFYLIQGAVRIHIHNTSYTVCTGGSFMVPRGNMYFIQNIAHRDAILFFAQARKIKEGTEEQRRAAGQAEDDEMDDETDRGSRSRSRSHTLVQKGQN